MNGRFYFPAAVFFLAAASFLQASGDGYQLQNEFIFLKGSDGSFEELRIDPRGEGEFGENLISRLGIGDPLDRDRSYELERSESELVFRNLSVFLPKLLKQEARNYPREIVARWAQPDRLMGGSPLFLGEITQGGPGGTAGSVGVEGEFPESGMVPASFLYTVIGAQAKPDGLHIQPRLPQSLQFAGVENLSYNRQLWNVTVTHDEVTVTAGDGTEVFKERIAEDEAAVFRPFDKM